MDDLIGGTMALECVNQEFDAALTGDVSNRLRGTSRTNDLRCLPGEVLIDLKSLSRRVGLKRICLDGGEEFDQSATEYTEGVVNLILKW